MSDLLHYAESLKVWIERGEVDEHRNFAIQLVTDMARHLRAADDRERRVVPRERRFEAALRLIGGQAPPDKETPLWIEILTSHPNRFSPSEIARSALEADRD